MRARPPCFDSRWAPADAATRPDGRALIRPDAEASPRSSTGSSDPDSAAQRLPRFRDFHRFAEVPGLRTALRTAVASGYGARASVTKVTSAATLDTHSVPAVCAQGRAQWRVLVDVKKIAPLAGMVLLSVSLLAGCGDGGGDSTASGRRDR